VQSNFKSFWLLFFLAIIVLTGILKSMRRWRATCYDFGFLFFYRYTYDLCRNPFSSLIANCRSIPVLAKRKPTPNGDKTSGNDRHITSPATGTTHAVHPPAIPEAWRTTAARWKEQIEAIRRSEVRLLRFHPGRADKGR